MKKILLFLFTIFSIAVNAQHVRVNQIKSPGQPEGRFVITNGTTHKLKISSIGIDSVWNKGEITEADTTRWANFPVASTTTLGGVKIDGTSITINDGIISAPNAGGGTVVAVTGTDPIVSSGGNSPAISIKAATQTQTGSMSSTDKSKLDNLWNYTVQSLSGTTPTWNVASGLTATMTISGNTTITLTGLKVGMPGTLFVANPINAYYIKFAGVTADIKGNNLTIDSNGILCSGNSANDSFGWTWDGSILHVHVAKEYVRITWN